MRWSDGRRGPIMASSLPMTLRFYRGLSSAMVPFAPAVIRRRLPMVLINGRMSQRSFPRWRRVHGTISAILEKFDICLAQSETDAERFSALGCRNVVITGNLKLDVPAPPADSFKLERLLSMT